MSKRVLIAYGTRFGSTEEVSQEIAKILEEEGIDFQLLDLRKTKSKEWPSIEKFDGILVGSGIKIMKWTKEPKEFLKKHKNEFNKREKILGMFVCSAYASVPKNRSKAKEDYLEKTMTELGIKADIYDAFGGVFDFSESSRMGFLDKKMLNMAAKGLEKDLDLKIEKNTKNDLRDWEQIRNFAEKFATLMKD